MSLSRAGAPFVIVLAALSLALLWTAAGGESAAQEDPDRTEIKLRFATFDPLVDGPPEVPAGLTAPEDADAYIVQFTSAPSDELRGRLTALGVQVHQYLPDHAHIVRMDDATRETVEALEFVRWVGPYHPAYKLEEELIERLEPPIIIDVAPASAHEQRYSIMTLQRSEDQQRVAAAIRELQGEVHLVTEQGFRLEATLDDSQLRAVVQLSEILFIDRWFPPEDDMDIVREIDGADFLEDVAGYTGQGVRGEVMDNRLLTTHEGFAARPPIIHGGNNAPTQNCAGNGHGTCAYGIVFGDGAGNAQARGLLPDGQGIYADRSFVGDRYAHTAELVDPTDDFRAVFQSNSWGGGLTTQYTTVSAEFDDILFINDILVTQSQSNNGTQMSRPQAWAKNVVSVGGIRHQNTLDTADDQWSGGASIGPAADGRLKPDLSHFYDFVLTTNSTGDTNYFQFGGTSAATPITAGYFGLFFQMWADGVFSGGPGLGGDVFDSRPPAATAKAIMINTAEQYDFDGTGDDPTRVHQGWGRAGVRHLYELARQHQWALPLLVNESAPISDGGVHEYTLDVGAEACTLKATLVYKDPMGNPAATQHRVNDLSLRVTSPGGTVYWGNNGLDAGNWSTPGGSANTVDTVENVFVEEADLGSWTIAVLGDEIVEDAHPATAATDAVYALVVTKCAELDAEVVSVDPVDPPDEIYVGEDVAITIEAEVANHGPGGPEPAAFDVTFEADPPANCSIVGPAEQTVPVTLGVGATDTLQAIFTIHCTEPSFHTFDFRATITPTDPDVRDTDPTNDTNSTELTVGVVLQVDVDVLGLGFDTDRLRAVIAPVEPGEPMVGLGPLAAPWAGAGDRPLPWARTPVAAPADCPNADAELPQPGHGNWANPRTPITLVVTAPGEPVSLFVDGFTCSSHDVNVETTVTLEVVEGICDFGGAATASETVTDALAAGSNLGGALVAFPDALTIDDDGCTLLVEIDNEPADIHYELVGNVSGSTEVVLVAARDGRMTGGGTFVVDGERYTHGFQLRCDGSSPHNLQVRWAGNRFQLSGQVGVLCFEDPSFSPAPPAAGLNTIIGNGVGRLNGVAGTPVWFHLTDAGQPGTDDLVELVIDAGPLVSAQLEGGNHQALPPPGRPGS